MLEIDGAPAGHQVPDTTPGAPGRPGVGAVLAGLVGAARPRQWVKNVLVASAPFFARELDHPRVIGELGLAFIVFCLVSSGIYYINDVRDRPFDRSHPTKRHRPIAAGIVPVWLAIAVGVSLLTIGLAFAALLSTPELALDAGVYVGISLAYCFFLKDQPVIDLAVIASGFLLRAMAGGLATGTPLSQWFLLVASFGALFIAAGKRFSELVAVGDAAAATRRSLASYSASYLRFLWGTSAAVTITTYSLWAFEVGQKTGGAWAVISIAPFVLGLLRYAVDIDNARAGTPEDIAFGDRALQVLGVLWLTFFILGVVT